LLGKRVVMEISDYVQELDFEAKKKVQYMVKLEMIGGALQH